VVRSKPGGVSGGGAGWGSLSSGVVGEGVRWWWWLSGMRWWWWSGMRERGGGGWLSSGEGVGCWWVWLSGGGVW
jgi:hypothetical protein